MEKNLVYFLIQFGFLGAVALFLQKWFGWRKWSFIYLLLIPGISLFRGELPVLLWGVLMAVMMKNMRSWRWLVVWLVVGWLWLGLGRMDDFGIKLVTINQQRGEHLLAGENFFSRWFHNKLDLIYWLWMNVEKRISLAALFAGNQRGIYSNYLPVGFLFWWDVGFLVMAVRRGWHPKNWKWLVWGAGLLIMAVWPKGRWADGWEVAVGYYLALVILGEINRLSGSWFRTWLLAIVAVGLVNLWLASRLIVAL